MAIANAPSDACRTAPGRAAARPRPAITAAALLLLGSILLLAGCSGDGEKNGAPAAAAAASPAAAQPAGAPPGPEVAAVPVAVAPVTTGEIASYYRATATLEAEKEAQVLGRVSGMVQTLSCEEGDRVREGQVLLAIENDEYRLRMQQAEATTATVRSRFERMQEMLKEGLTTEEEFQTARSDLQNAEAQEGLAKLEVTYTTVRAPFSGMVVQRLVNAGQHVSVGTPLFLLSDFDPLLARVHVPAKEFRSLKADQPVALVLDSDGSRLEGRIILVSPVIDAGSGTIKITVEVPRYPAGTRPGDFAEVQVVTERHTGATLVPRGAVISEKGEDVVYVAAAGLAERRVIETGFTDLDHAEVLSGVAPGEQVVVKGQRSLKHGMPLKVLTDGQEPAETPATAAR